MRILVVSNMFPSDVRPHAGTFVFEQAKALAKRGHQVLTLVPVQYVPPFLMHIPKYKELASIPEWEKRGGLLIHRVRYPALKGWAGSVSDAYMQFAPIVKETYRLNKKKRIDAVVGHVFGKSALAAAFAANATGIPCVSIGHGSEIRLLSERGKLALWNLRLNAKLTDAAIVVSKDLKVRLLEYAGDLLSGKRVEVVYSGVDAESINELPTKDVARSMFGLPENAPIVLFVGRIEKKKGAHDLVSAFGKIKEKNPSARLIMIGELKEPNILSGNEDGIEYKGTMPHSKVLLYYRAADVFVLPSYTEGVPVSMLEAMGTGCPVVTTAVGGIPEIVHHPSAKGQTAVIVDIANPDMLASEITKLLMDKELANKLATNARSLVLSEFLWDKNAERLEEILQGIVTP